MIKGLGYLKSLKRSLIGFGISCFTVFAGSSVNGYYCNGTNTSCYDLPFGQASEDLVNGAIIDNSFNFRNGYFNFSYDGTRYLNYWWQSDGLYFTKTDWRGSNPQYGKVDGYFICGGNPFLGQTLSSISSCVYHTGFNDFGSQIVSKDLYGFYCVATDGYSNCNLCVYSSGSSYVCVDRSYISDTHDTFLDVVAIEGRLTQNPFFGSNSVNTGSVNYDCSWSDVLVVLESEGYNKYVCYGGLDNFDLYDSSLTYNIVPGSGLSVADIWGWSGSRAWDSFPEWFMFRNGLYRDNSESNFNAMWESYPAVYRSYFQLFNTYNGGPLIPRTILEYCQLRTLDGSLLNNSAGGYFQPVCETVVREKQTGLWQSRLNGTLYSGGIYTGDIPLSVNWSGVGNMSGDLQGDSVNFLQNFFDLAKSKLSTNYGNNIIGVLPSYIIVFLLALILFRFLSH